MSAQLHPARTAETALLAEIHARSLAVAPRLKRILPLRAAEGDPVLLLGHGLGGELRVLFGPVVTWAVPVSDRAAVALVPQGAVGGSVSVYRQGLRSNSLVFGGPPGDGNASVVRIDPKDGATGVFRDAPVVVRLSHAVDASSVYGSVRVDDPEGRVPGQVLQSPDRHVLVWTAERLLAPGATHIVSIDGLRDVRGYPVPSCSSRFVPCQVTWSDLTG